MRKKRGREVGFLRWWEVEEKGKIVQHCAIFCNRKNTKRREPLNAVREPGLKGMGSGRFRPPLSPPDGIQSVNGFINQLSSLEYNLLPIKVVSLLCKRGS